MARPRFAATRLFAAVLAASALAVSYPASPRAISSSIVISQVYGAGGNAGASFTHDFIELFNRGNTPVSLAGWSLQYASATGTGNFGASATQLTELPAVVIAPGQYFLVQEAGGTTGTPTSADAVDSTPISMSGSAGKVALVTSIVTLGCNGGSTPCSPAQLAAIVDLVGYGTGASGANFFEGSGAAPSLTATTSAVRRDAGCTDTDQNGADFTAGPVAPRNTVSTIHPCAGLGLLGFSLGF